MMAVALISFGIGLLGGLVTGAILLLATLPRWKR